MKKPAWLAVGIVVRRQRIGCVAYTVEIVDRDRERAKLAEITDGMPGAMWVSFKTLSEKWEPRGCP